MPSAGRALAFALALLLLPLAGAQGEPEIPQEPEPPEQFDCQLEDCFPDLIPSNPVTDATDDRFPVTACTDFVNIGRGATAVPFRILLEIDGIAVSERQMQGVYQQGGGERDICWEGLQLGRGRHTMDVVVDHQDDIMESNERNNRRQIVFFVRAPPEVDLVVRDLYVTPKEAGTGVTQTFVLNVTNWGQATSNATTVDLSDETGVLASWPLPSLQPGQMKTYVLPTRADVRPVGTFIARALVDPGDNVSELDEENNDRFVEYTVLEHPAPDYQITNVTISGNRTELRGIRIDVMVTNMGDRAVRGTTVRILNETNETIAHGVTRNIITPGTSGVVQFYTTLRAGDHKLRLIADPTQVVAERDETNNEWPLEITILPAEFDVDLPNLIVERIYAMPEDPRPGEPVSVGALVHNIGTNTSNATVINFTVDGVVIGSAQVPALKAGAYYSAYVPWAGGNASVYRIAALADAPDKVFEYDDADNLLQREFLIATQAPPPATTPTPTAPTTPTPTTPEPAAPEPETPAPTTPTETLPLSQRVAFGEIILSTRPVPGGVKGVISASLRNPNIQPLGALTVQFRVDGDLLVERLVPGIRGAATTAVTTGEIDLPGGDHTITAELRAVGSSEAPLVRERQYEAEPGAKGIAGFETLGALAALATVVLWRRR